MEFKVKKEDLEKIIKQFDLDSPEQLQDVLQTIEAITFASRTKHPITGAPGINLSCFGFITYAMVKMACMLSRSDAKAKGQNIPQAVGGQFDMFMRVAMAALSEIAALDKEEFEKEAAEIIMNNKPDEEKLH